MKKTVCITVVLVFLSTAFIGCKKDKLKSRYAGLLQHKWTYKNSSSRFSVIGSYQGPWETKQMASGTYREYRSDGTWTVGNASSSFTEAYEFLTDTIVLLTHPGTPATPVSNPIPDTMFIKEINDSLLLTYTRKFFISPNYSSLNEGIDSLYR